MAKFWVITSCQWLRHVSWWWNYCQIQQSCSCKISPLKYPVTHLRHNLKMDKHMRGSEHPQLVLAGQNFTCLEKGPLSKRVKQEINPWQIWDHKHLQFVLRIYSYNTYCWNPCQHLYKNCSNISYIIGSLSNVITYSKLYCSCLITNPHRNYSRRV